MILRTLTLRHFKQYGHLELTFRLGLAGIVGRNGAGKSSIFEAVLLCLFGDIRGDKKLIRSSWVSEKETVSLQLLFEIDNRSYRIVREFRGKALTHYAHLFDHRETAIASGANPVGHEVEKLIGMDKDAFTRSIFSGQKELGEISNTRGEERRKLVRKMVGLDKLDRIQNLVREDRNKIKNQISGKSNLLFSKSELKEKEKELKSIQKQAGQQEKSLEKLARQLASQQKNYEQARQAFDEENKRYQQHNNISQQLTKYETAVDGFVEKKKEYDQRINTLKQLDKTLKKQAPEIAAFEQQKKELDSLEKEKSKFEKRSHLLESQHRYLDELKELDKQIRSLGDLEKEEKQTRNQLSVLAKAAHELEGVIDSLEQQLLENHRRLTSLTTRITERNQQAEQIRQLGKSAECPTCFQPLVDQYENALERLQTEIENYTDKELKAIQQDIDGIAKKKNKLVADREKRQKDINQLHLAQATLEEKKKQQQHLLTRQSKGQKILADNKEQISQLGKINYEEKAYQKLKQTILRFEPTYIQYRSQRDDVDKLPEWVAAKKQIDERIQKGKATIADQKKEMKALGFSEKAYEKSQKDLQNRERLRDKSQELHHQQKEALFQLTSSQQEVANTLRHQRDIQQSIDEQRRELTQLQALDATFTKFKSQALDRVRPIIGHHASNLFNQITRGRYESIRVNEDFEFLIFDNGGYYPISRFSGGEIDLANLCLRIAISKAISELSGSPAALSLLCFDEIFGSQDEERRFEILRAFDLLKEQYRQIYIVSHIESIKDYFPHILQVRKGRGGAVAEWAGGG